MTGKRRRRRNRHKREKNTIIGPWKLIKILGDGGNGEVWEVSREGHENHAMKLLKNTDAVTYNRFKAEIHILSNHSIAGIIPLVESNLPNEPNDVTPWFVMPKAVPFERYTEEKSSIELAKQFVLLGKTLDELHSQSISHRDIKPENILFYKGRLCFADFGLVKYPGKENITPEKRDVGAKFTMAPEMRREASSADGIPADVFSLAKSLWIALTKKGKGFDGQYNPSSILSVKNYCDDLYTTPLDNLLVESTDTDPFNRPSAKAFANRLLEWIELNEDFHSRNLLEWLEVQKVIFPNGPPSHATWTDIDSICSILNEIGHRRSLNHMFYPTSGGMDLIKVSKAEEKGMLALHVCERSAEILKPKKLTYESVGYHPQWNYFRLEVDEVEPTGVEGALDSTKTSEALLEIEPGKYVEYKYWDYGEFDGKPLPKTARPVGRYLKGSFVLFSKRSIYNRTNATYDAWHNKMSETEFKKQIEASAKTCFESDVE